ncbi:MAG: hypothetical protein KIT62_07810 [Cyclobacteriaceae bacterium]|nr:hypothetical protein [Cyclobacteriaceae bacterium]
MRYGWIFILALLTCNDKPVTVDLGTDFFPLRTGREWTYSVSKTTYTYLSEPVTESYQLKIAIADSTLANGIASYFILISTRNTTGNPWQVVSSWSAHISGNQVIQNESNITRVKMIFPVGPATVWDGNQYNDEPPFLEDYVTTPGQRLFRIENYNQPKDLASGLNFESTLTVVISDLSDPIIGEDIQKEIYARNIGLVQKEVSQLVFCMQGSCTGLQQGTRYTQTLTSYVP